MDIEVRCLQTDQVSSQEKSMWYVVQRDWICVQATNIRQPAVLASKDLLLKAVYSRSLKSTESVAASVKDVALYSDESGEGSGLDDLLARPDIKAIIIALPIMSQPEYIRKALLAGKHVLSEKPIGPTVKDAKDLIKWYRATVKPEITWAVAENFRYLDR